jgi:hypothetical protein
MPPKGKGKGKRSSSEATSNIEAPVDKDSRPNCDGEKDKDPTQEDENIDQGSSKTAKKQKSPPLLLSEEQEEALADWLKNHDFLFVKGRKEFKNTSMKNGLWQTKADELNIDKKALYTWYESIRTK